MSGIHVFLGPSLDRDTAKQLLPGAHYHPPIRCGDLIALLRLSPKQIIIIDGFYESIPAVWHKEILLAMEMGASVCGSASIGALRAAELHPFGMLGFGQVYQDYETGVLSDDDEVAVLHGEENKGFVATNDAMVNIRYTCQAACDKKIISTELSERLIIYCKNQFYPYRSLMSAAMKLGAENYLLTEEFIPWLREHGMVDVKRQDAMAVLRHYAVNPLCSAPSTRIDVRSDDPSESSQLAYKTPMTMFLRNTTYYANLTPFKYDCDSLPQIEKQLQCLYRESIAEYRLVAELAHFLRCLFSLQTADKLLIQQEPLDVYMRSNGLYSPDDDFSFYKNHAQFSSIYHLICQSICIDHITNEKIEHYLPVIAHYYDLGSDLACRNKPMLRRLLVLIFSIERMSGLHDVELSRQGLTEQLRNLFIRRAYEKNQREKWSFPAHIDDTLFYSFLSKYFKVTIVYYPESPEGYYYFNWIYDAYHVYMSSVSYGKQACVSDAINLLETA